MEIRLKQAAEVETAARRMQETREELVERIAATAQEDRVVQPLPGVHMACATRPNEGIHSVYPTAFCVIAQGAKEVFIGSTAYRYDPSHFLLATVELPAVGRILEATRQKPYLSLRLNLDPSIIGSVMVEAGLAVPRAQDNDKAIAVSKLDADLLDACVRLVRLIDQPDDARVLAPMVKREIVYRLLTGEQGSRLRRMPVLAGNSHGIAKAIELLRANLDRPLSIDALARELGMSSSGLHHHFRSVTDMSPLQFQKQLRLQQARRLMVGENLDAATAGYRVGYSDASHFSRDYRKLFGLPPARDIEHLRASSAPIPATSTM